MPQVKVALQNLPDDAEVDVPYLGRFKNNSTTEVEQWKWDRYLQLHPGTERLGDSDTLEITTQATERISAMYSRAVEAVQSEERSLTDYKKDELRELARSIGVENADEMKKDELVAAIEAAGRGRPEPVQQPQEGEGS